MSAPAVGRKLFFFERFLFVGGRHTWNVLLAARREGTLEETALQEALARLQQRHPTLRAGIVETAAPAFVFIDPPPPIGIRIVERADEATCPTEMKAELERPFDVERGPLARLIWIRAEQFAELVLVTHHCVCDGRSNQILMRELLDALDRPDKDMPALPGPFALDGLFGGPPHGAERLGHQILAAGVTALLRVMSASVRQPVSARPPNYMFRWQFDAATSRALAERCAHENVTRYTAIATALLRAFHNISPQSKHRLLCPIDMRALLPSLTPDMLFPFAETVTLTIRPASDQDFWAEARALRAELGRRRKRLDPRRKLRVCEHAHGAADRLVDTLLHGRAGEDIMFSDLGNAELGTADRVSALGFVASIPWQGATGIFSIRDRETITLFFVSRETHLAQHLGDRLCKTAEAELRKVLR